MQLELTLDEHLYKDICSYCQYNKLDISEYLATLIADAHNTNKFGAVPPMFVSQTPVSTPQEVKSEPIITTVSVNTTQDKTEKFVENEKKVADTPKVDNKPKRTRKTITAK